MSTPARRTHAPGEPGVWLIVIADIAVFLILFGTFLHYRDGQPGVFARGQDALTPGFGFLDTLLLLTSSLAVVTGVHAHREGRPRAADRALLIGILLGCAFVVSKVVEWSIKAHAGHVPDENDFFALYFILTGLHLFHVLIGLFVLALARRIAARSAPRAQDTVLVESGAIFWHMVDLLWLVLFALVYFVH